MKNFKQTKLALAVGTALMVMAGAAQAAAPTVRATTGVLVNQVNAGTANADVRALLSTTGMINKAIRLDISLDTAVAGGNSTGGVCVSAGDNVNGTINVNGAPAVAGGQCTLVAGNATLANNHVVAYTGTTATQVPSTGATATLSASAAGKAHITFSLPAPGAAKGYRLTAGKLEYCADTAAATPVWTAVKVDVQVVAGKEIYTEADATAGRTNAAEGDMAASTANAPGNSLAPTPTIATTGSATGLVNGFVVDTGTPITLAAANLAVAVDANALTGFAGTTAFPAAAIGTITCAAGKCTVPFVGLGAAATSADFNNSGAVDTTDAALYKPEFFNTGITGATVPFSVDGVNASKASYSEVFNVTDGGASKLANAGGLAAGDAAAFAAIAGDVVTDGAAPVALSAVTGTAGEPAGTSRLTITFSEPLAAIGNATNDLREVAENVKLGADTIAALNLNANGTLAFTTATSAINQGELKITGIRTTDLTGKQVSVTKGITVKEQNDTGYSLTADVIEVATDGGVTTAANETLTMAAAATTAEALTIGVGGDTTADAQTTAADPTKVGSIRLKFTAGKEVALNATAPAKTLANLASDLVVTVNGLAGQTPVSFKVYPTAADLALSTAGDILTITLPTALIYEKINVTTTMNVAYAVTNVADVLVGKASATTIVAAGNENVVLPLSATATINTLLTQSIQGTLTGASNGSLVHAYMAKWEDKPSTTISVSLTSGKVTSTGDKVATDLMLEYADGTGNALKTLIAAQLNAPAAAVTAVPGVKAAVAAVTAKPIPVYIKLIRSSDTQANTKGAQNYLEARAILGTTITSVRGDGAATTVATAHSADQDPVYECMLDPKTGKITGRLTGEIGIKPATTVTGVRGLTQPGGAAGALEVAQGLVDATGKFNLLVGVEPTTADLAAGAKGNPWFLVLVHEDQNNTRKFTQLTSASPGAANFVTFDPNLLNGKGTRTILGTAPGIAAPFTATTGSAASISLANYHVASLANSTNWALVAARNPALASGTAATGSSNFERTFVGLDSTVGAPASYWTNDGATADMAMALAGNKMSLATELAADGSSLNTFGPTSYVPNAVAIAWSNDVLAANKTLTFAQAAAPTTPAKVPVGWSLVPVPAAGLTAATVDAVINVGAGATQFTWIKATDGAMPALTAGQPVFVFSKAGGTL